MTPFVSRILFGIGAFSVFMTIALVLKLISHSKPVNAEYFGLFTNSDLLLGVLVAIFVTIARERKKKLK
jgi:NADH:ubiquinone oxidoreductase subunit K